MIYIDLIFNLTLLIALSIVAGFIENHWPRRTRLGVMLQGLLFGGSAVLGMLRPMNLGPGLIFDGRSIMVSLCALFFGPWAAIVSGTLPMAYRLWLGGMGTITGSLVILSSAGIGLLGYFYLKPVVNPPTTGRLYMFGFAVHIAMVAMMYTLPGGAGPAVAMKIGPPVLLLYPLATILAGKILSDRMEAERVMEALRKAKEQAEAANRYKTDFITNISHDLRTPLNAILGFAYILKSADLEEKHRKSVDFINDRAKHLLALVEDILDVSKIDSGKIELKSEEFDFQKLLENSVEASRVGIGKKDVTISLAVKGTIPRLKGDPLLVRKIVDNLLSNAVKYTERGEIKLTIEPDARQPDNDKYRVDVSVKDTGFGIPAKDLAYIFNPFARFHEFYKGRTYEGVGLGLHIVQELVRLMGGSVSVASEVDKGTEFRVALTFDKKQTGVSSK